MDAAGFGEIPAKQSFRFIGLVNRFLGGVRLAQRFVAEEAARMTDGRPLRILDIGAGACDIPLAVCRWARRKGIPLHFTCIENGSHAVSIARDNLRRANRSVMKGKSHAGGFPIELVQEDIFRHLPSEPYHCAVGSMFFHHLPDDGILRLIDRLGGFVRGRLLINDLRRGFLCYLGCRLIVIPFSGVVAHDALLSVRKSFKVGELRNLLGNLRDASAEVSAAPFFRVRGVVDYGNTGGNRKRSLLLQAGRRLQEGAPAPDFIEACNMEPAKPGASHS
jgi:hypothetical protein